MNTSLAIPGSKKATETSWSAWIAKVGLLPLVFVALIIFFAVQAPGFFEIGNLTNIARQSAYLLLISLGQMLVLLCAKLDLSVGATAALTSVVTALFLTGASGTGLTLGLAVVVGLCVGLAVGLLNGVLVAYFKVPAFMATLGTTSIATGTALILSNGVPVRGVPLEFSDVFGTSRMMGVPTPVVIAVIITVLMYVVLVYTPLGRAFYAVGGNETAARIAGIRVSFVIIMAFVLCSMLTSLAGVLLTARVASGEASLGTSYVMLSIAAAVLGGTSLFGGVGKLPMVVLGVLFLGLLSNGMNLMQVSSYVQELVMGVVLVAAVAVDRFRAQP